MPPRIHKPDAGPTPLSEVLSRLFTERGWGRRQGRLKLDAAWAEAVGPQFAPHTRVGGLRRGVLEVEVDSAVIIQELAHYHKRRLMSILRQKLPGVALTDLRFRAGAPPR
jgi:predicted nucleic acid-binding Zn ribbon protein